MDQHHPDPGHLEGGHIPEDGIHRPVLPQGGAAVLKDHRLPGAPGQPGQGVQQAQHLLHAVQVVLHVVLVEPLLGVVHVGDAVDIGGAPLLPGLRPLAGDEDDGGGLGLHHRHADGLAPVGLDGVVALALDVPRHFPGDVQHVLLAGVLLGDDDLVGVFGGDLREVLPPVQGLLARAAEDDDHPLARVLLLHGEEELFKAQAVVGVVHDGGDVAVGVLVDLHAAGHPGLHEAHIDVLLGDAQALAHGDGGQGVLDVEEAGHGEPELPAEPGGPHPEEDVPALLAHVACIDRGGGVVLGEGDEPPAGLPGGVEHVLHPLGVQVDHGQGGVAEDLQLGGEVVLKVGVLDGGDVIVADVEEDGGREGHAVHAVVLQSLGGDLHGEVLHSAPGGIGEVALEVQGLRGGEVGLEPLHAVVGVDGGDDAALRLFPGGQVLVKDILEVICGGAFPLCTGDTHHVELGAGVVVVEVGQEGHGPAHVGHLEAGGVPGLGPGVVGEVDEGPLPEGVGEVLALEVGPLDDEEGPRPDVLGVAGDQRHGGGEEGGREGLSAGEEPLLLEELPVVAQGADGKIHMCHLVKDYRRRVFSVVTVSMPLPAEK